MDDHSPYAIQRDFKCGILEDVMFSFRVVLSRIAHIQHTLFNESLDE